MAPRYVFTVMIKSDDDIGLSKDDCWEMARKIARQIERGVSLHAPGL